MKIIIRQNIAPDISITSQYMKMENKSYANAIHFLNSNIFSLEFEFISENEKDFKDYWYKIWRLQKHIDYINNKIVKIINGEINIDDSVSDPENNEIKNIEKEYWDIKISAAKLERDYWDKKNKSIIL